MGSEVQYLISRTKKAVSLINEDDFYVNKWKVEAYVNVFDLIREDIAFIAIESPKEAKTLMLEFIEQSYYVFGGISDNDDFIKDFFQKCIKELVIIYGKLHWDIQEIVAIICHMVCIYKIPYKSNYRAYFDHNIIYCFRELLSKNNGFDMLKYKLTELVNDKKKKKDDFLYHIENVLNEIVYYIKNATATEYESFDCVSNFDSPSLGS